MSLSDASFWAFLQHIITQKLQLNVMYDKAKSKCKLLAKHTVHPRTSDSTYAYIHVYRHGLENKTTTLYCYKASMLNNNLLFGYSPQVHMRHQLHTDSSSVPCLKALTSFVPCGSNKSWCIGQFWNFTSVWRWLENSATCKYDKWLNATNTPIYFNGKFGPSRLSNAPQMWRHVCNQHCILVYSFTLLGMAHSLCTLILKLLKCTTIDTYLPVCFQVARKRNTN